MGKKIWAPRVLSYPSEPGNEVLKNLEAAANGTERSRESFKKFPKIFYLGSLSDEFPKSEPFREILEIVVSFTTESCQQ